jgi:hypothetical protein
MRVPPDVVRWVVGKVPPAGKAPLQAWIEARLEQVPGVAPVALRGLARTLDDLLAIDANLAAATREVGEALAQREGTGPSTALALASLARGERAEARRTVVAAIDALDAQVRALATASAALATRAREADIAAGSAQSASQSATDAVATLEQRLKALRGAVPDAEKPSTPEGVVTAPLGCKVPGCGGTHRARGFCGKHYQLWRRDLLEGYVRFEGGVRIDGVLYDADAAHGGRPARYENGRIVVDA